MPRYTVVQLDSLQAVPCPCGTSRRAFAGDVRYPFSLHLVRIAGAARTHYHRRMTETYVVLEGEGHLELDGEQVLLRPLTAVVIRPECRHRAVGTLTLLNIVSPPFDPEDEHLV